MVPSIFVDSIQGTEPQDMSLRDCNNNLWRLKIEKFHDGWHFTDGWVQFVEDNGIKRGDVLYYESSSRGVLDFRVLGPSGCNDDGVEHLEIRTAKPHYLKAEVKVEDVEAADDIARKPPKRRGKEKVVDDGDRIERLEIRTTKQHDVKMKVKVEDVGAADDIDKRSPQRRGKEKVVDDGERNEHPEGVDERPLRKRDEEKVVDACASVHRKRKKKQDFYGTEIFKSGRVPMPKNPYFVAEVREKRVNEMYIPVDVVKSYKIELPLELRLVDSEGRKFHTTRTLWKDGRVNYCGGWKTICRANLAEIGDHLICEFIGGRGGGDEGDLHLRVTFIRAE